MSSEQSFRSVEILLQSSHFSITGGDDSRQMHEWTKESMKRKQKLAYKPNKGWNTMIMKSFVYGRFSDS